LFKSNKQRVNLTSKASWESINKTDSKMLVTAKLTKTTLFITFFMDCEIEIHIYYKAMNRFK